MGRSDLERIAMEALNQLRMTSSVVDDMINRLGFENKVLVKTDAMLTSIFSQQEVVRALNCTSKSLLEQVRQAYTEKTKRPVSA